MKTHIRLQSAFTLVEIMIVVAIIGLLAAIAVPNFARARAAAQQNACIANLRQIDGAKQQWALEAKLGGDVDANESANRTAVNAFLKSPPECPAGGTYNYGKITENPTCTKTGHTLPPSS
jgi:prepilin-type N-terminal cleavage/methylation domain-containing protein